MYGSETRAHTTGPRTCRVTLEAFCPLL